MSQIPEGHLESLALAIATSSMSINTWSSANGVSDRTGRRWSNRPGVRARIAEIHREYTNRAVGVMVVHATAAAATLARIVAPNSESRDADRIAAAKALLAAMIDLRAVADLEERLAAVEAQLKTKKAKPSERQQDQASAGID